MHEVDRQLEGDIEDGMCVIHDACDRRDIEQERMG